MLRHWTIRHCSSGSYVDSAQGRITINYRKYNIWTQRIALGFFILKALFLNLYFWFLGILQKFFKDTIIYGLAIVLPRLINFLLVKLHTDVLPNEGYSENTEFYIVAAFFNVILTYGLETSFFRFFSRHKEKARVLSTALISIVVSTIIFGILLFSFRESIATLLRINQEFYTLLVSITSVSYTHLTLPTTPYV